MSAAALGATADTPRAREEIEKYDGPYPGDRIMELRAIYKAHLEDAGFETLAGRTPPAQIKGRKVPLFVIDAEYDPVVMQKSAVALMGTICDRDGKCPRHKQIAGHNHYSMT